MDSNDDGRTIGQHPEQIARRRRLMGYDDDRAFDGMSSLGERSPKGEELAAFEDDDVCPSCGVLLASAAGEGCALVEEHGTQVLELSPAELLRDHGISTS